MTEGGTIEKVIAQFEIVGILHFSCQFKRIGSDIVCSRSQQIAVEQRLVLLADFLTQVITRILFRLCNRRQMPTISKLSESYLLMSEIGAENTGSIKTKSEPKWVSAF